MTHQSETRPLVFARESNRCLVCGKRAEVVHEIVPRSALPGKRNEITLFSMRNSCLLCPECHGQVHTVWGRSMLLGLMRLRYGYAYDDRPFRNYFEVTVL
jgi:5-methylcytosine-specific restriction endonuclease McrA